MAKKKVKTQKNVFEQEHRTKTRMEAIYECVLFVDWHKIRKVMKALNCTWITTNDEVPSVDDLKNQAIVLFEDAFKIIDGIGLTNDGKIEERETFLSRGGVYVKLYIEDNEVCEIECGFTLESNSVFMWETKDVAVGE
jgi:hypothetical protein